MELTLQLKLESMASNIKKNLNEMQSLFLDRSLRYEFVHPKLNPEDDIYYEALEITEQLEEQFEILAKRVFWSGKIFFEMQNLHHHRMEFINEIGPILKNSNILLLAGSDVNYAEEYSDTIECFRKYFFPFAEFMDNAEVEQSRLTGLTYVETILHNTAPILNQLKVIPTREADIYNSVKVVLTSTFPHHQEPDFIFMKDAKCYRPDILLPGLETAIEYKYAKTEKEINTTLDEIFTDVHGYSKHPNYTRFYAVFYVKAGVISKKRFDVLWESKKFPRNWNGIFVEGF